MLIKEYRIPLPLTVEEYKIAQLYMIQKKSREESEGSDSAVEIIKNEPYTDGPNGSGQYTDKIYHIDRHLPGWLRSLAPKTALEVHEESWNAYPYTKTKFSVPFVEKFQIHLETLFIADSGHQENVFNLKGAELNEREIVVMDMVTEQLTGHDYKQEEDPHLFRSQKTGRGPLMDDWRTNPPDGVIMCAYKLIKIEFRYWGLQSKVERLIDHALHRIMLRAHKQAWAWQDEWVGLTMDDIRTLERDTQRILQEKLNHAPSPHMRDPHPEGAVVGHSSATPTGGHSSATPPGEERSLSVAPSQGQSAAGAQSYPNGELNGDTRRASRTRRKGSTHRRRSQADGTVEQTSNIRSKDPDTESMYSTQMELALDSIALSSDSDSEFFDATDTIQTEDEDASGSVVWHDAEDDGDQDHVTTEATPSAQEASSPPHTADMLFLVVDSGLYLDEQGDKDLKMIDFQTFVDLLRETARHHFRGASSHLAFRPVPCPNFSSGTLQVLQGLDPWSWSSSPPGALVFSHYCMAVLPLLVTESSEYLAGLGTLVATANGAYQEFLASEEGRGFTGQVCIVAHYLGSLAVYDILTGLGTSTGPGTGGLGTSAASSGVQVATQSPSSPSSCAPSSPSSCAPSQSAHSLRSASQQSTTDKHAAILEEASGPSGLQFKVSHFFAFGSPLGLVLASRLKRSSSHLCQPQPPFCSGFYNIFYAVDPLASRVEPVLDHRFRQVDPIVIPTYKQFPKGVLSLALNETLSQYPLLFARKDTITSSEDPEAASPIPSWWFDRRIDHVLESPQGVEGFQSFSLVMFSQVVSSRYWETQEMASFILRQTLHSDVSMASSSHELPPFVPRERAGPWDRRRTAVKIKKLSSNHRASDVVYMDSSTDAVLVVRFQYGPLDVVSLTKEKVDIYMLPPSNRLQWQFVDSVLTDRNGRLNYSIPGEKVSEKGVYALKYLVKGDHTTADCNMFALPAATEAILFSFDGALAAKFSLGARDIQIRPEAVEVVRYWQELGYFLIYATRRPDTQKEDLLTCLATHNFPLGMVVCSEGITSNDSGSLRTQLLRLVKEAKISIHAAYGSSRHIPLYQELGVQPNQSFIHSKKAKQAGKKQDECQFLKDGFASHLAYLRGIPPIRPMTDISKVLGTLSFGLTRQSAGKAKLSRASFASQQVKL